MVHEALTDEALSALGPGEAAAYFVARRAEGFTQSEEALLADWLARDEQNRRLFASADRAWQTFAEAEDDEILAAMRAHALGGSRRAFASWRPIAAVAGMLVAACAALFFLMPNLRLTPSTTYASARGQVEEIVLADGSAMTLDADSVVVAQINANMRDIQLQRGRAYFAVVSDPSRPFAVTAGQRSIVAMGTRFDVNLAADALIVTLLEGRVDIGAADAERAPLTLQPGQRYIERGAAPPIIEALAEPGEDAISWRAGVVSLYGMTLAEAVAITNRYSQEQIVIRDPAVAALPAAGNFSPGRALFAEDMAAWHNLRIVSRGDEIELTRQ